MIILTALSGASAVFLLYVLYHFRREDLRTRVATLRASRSVIVQELEPRVSVAARSSNLKPHENGKVLVLRLEDLDGRETIDPFARNSAERSANLPDDGIPADEEANSEEEE
jgi:hypothetical protein